MASSRFSTHSAEQSGDRRRALMNVRLPGAILGATQANDFPCRMNGYG
jgi:hypothetical protein